MTMMWVGLGTAAVGAVGQYASSRNAGGGAPQPQTLQGPNTPGAVQTDNFGYWIDPNTGMAQMRTNNYDPTSMGQFWDAQSMMNDFMGRGNSAMTDQIGAQIAQLQQKLAAAQKQGTSSNITNDDNKKRILGDNALLIDNQGNIDSKAVQQYSQPGDNNPFYQGFLAQTHGNYGGGFGKWMQDHVNRTLKPMAEKYKKDVGTQTGNTTTNDAYVQDLQNQINYLTQQQTKYGGNSTWQGNQTGSGNGSNPFQPYMSDVGAHWGGNMNNVNPMEAPWQKVTDDQISQIGKNPIDEMKQYLGNLTDPNQRQAAIDMFRSRIMGGGLMTPERGVAPQMLNPTMLDLNAAAAQENADNYRAAQAMDASQALLRQRLGNRGMGALGEIQAAGSGQNLIGQELQNAANARAGYNSAVGQNNSAMAQAAGQNNAANLAYTGNWNDAQAKAGALNLQGYDFLNGAQNALFGQGLQQAGLAQQMKQNWFQNAVSALQNQNQMRSEDRQWNLQDYQNLLGENATKYGRLGDQWNRLQTNLQQAKNNQFTQSGLNNQQLGLLSPNQMQMADWQNQNNAANTQMQNSWQMYNYQDQQARRAAANQALWGTMGSLGSTMMGYGMQNPSGVGNANRIYNQARNGGVAQVPVPNTRFDPSQDPVSPLGR